MTFVHYICLPISIVQALQQQLGQVSNTLFEEISTESAPNPRALINVYCARRDGLRQYMEYFGFTLSVQRTEVMPIFCLVLEFANDKLVQELSSVIIPAAGGARPSLLFYSVALFAYASLWNHNYDENVRRLSSFNTLISTMDRYKNLTIEKGMSDPDIESEFINGMGTPRTFSTDWWSSLEPKIRPLNPSTHNEISDADGPPLVLAHDSSTPE